MDAEWKEIQAIHRHEYNRLSWVVVGGNPSEKSFRRDSGISSTTASKKKTQSPSRGDEYQLVD